MRTADFTQYQGFDLLIGGSPCQDVSSLWSRKGLKGEKSGLFYEYYRAVQEVKPTYFLLENNANMSKSDRDTITKLLGVEPIMINSSLVSAQNRKRLYWTNIPNVGQPQDRNIKLMDIISLTQPVVDLVPYVQKKLPLLKAKYGEIPRMFNPYNLVEITEKCPCLTCENSQTKSSTVLLYDGECFKMLDSTDWELLQTLPLGYTACLTSEGKRKKVIGNGWTVDVIAHLLQGLKGIKESNGE